MGGRGLIWWKAEENDYFEAKEDITGALRLLDYLNIT